MSSVTLSIIIVSYNTKQITSQCLDSIIGANWESSYEIIVVDNNSQDGSVEMIQRKYPQVKLIINKENLFFAKANNQGASVANGKYLLLLNSDTIVWGDNIQRMINKFDSLPEDVICIGPRILNKDKSLQSCGMPTPGSIRAQICLNFKLGKILPPQIVESLLGIHGLQRDAYREVGWVSGACMMIRKELYDYIGGLNGELIFYGEEPEFGYRALKHHLRTYYYPDAEIIHLGGESTSNASDDEKLSRYAILQKESVGYHKAIVLSRIYILSLYIKRLFAPSKQYFNDAIHWEKKVISYLKLKCNEEEAVTH